MLFCLSLVFTFILRIRLKTIRDIFSYVRSRYNEDAVRKLRKFDNLTRKVVKTELDLQFLSKCKTFNIFPKFLRFKLYKKALHSSSLYRSWQSKLLVNEIQTKRKALSDCSLRVKDAEAQIRSAVSSFDSALISRYVSKRGDEFRKSTLVTHERKLRNLGIENDLQPFDPDKVVLNFSSVSLSQRVKTMLAFGLDFCLPVHKLNYFSYFLSFEKLFLRLKDRVCVNSTEFSDQIRTLAFKYFYNFKPYKIFSAIFSRDDIKTLKTLANNDDIIVCKPDKGKAVVIVNKSDYINSIVTLISDRAKFSEVTDCVEKYSRKMEDKVNNFLRKLKDLNLLDSDLYKQLFTSGSGPGILYGLPKIHKPDFHINFQFRPIFAAYNLPSFKLAKYLVPILKPITVNDFTVDNSYSFVQDLRTFNNADDLYMTSFDVENLFTNIPLKETIDIILDLLFVNCTTVLGLDRKFFKQLLELSVLNCFFIFNGKLYRQIEGLGMGLPLGPTFANIFMCYHEHRWLDQCPVEFKPVFYRRYVDDTFVLFRSKSHAKLFLDYLNSRHNSINFTMENEQSNKLPFLDTVVHRDNNSFQCSVFRKSSFTGLGNSYFSFSTFRFKLNSVLTLLNRAFNVCSTYSFLHDELSTLKQYFFNNGYPSSFIDSQINKFLNRKLCPSPPILTAAKEQLFLTLPYFGPQSETMKKQLLDLLCKYFVNLDFNIILVNKFTIGSLFNFKDKLPMYLRNSVVYNYSCARCACSYVGSTTRTLGVRIAEHSGRSYRTGAMLAHPSYSSVRAHAESCDVRVHREDFTILGSTSNSIDLRILESLHIFKRKPTLNETLSAFNLSIVNR